ncbi:MAG: hypothetical protein GF330_05075, partial [Candidatus Eisenbacteria bacterium]|nr:hypothetical protein [Candidatus Eisenbacteria bacterium]
MRAAIGTPRHRGGRCFSQALGLLLCAALFGHPALAQILVNQNVQPPFTFQNTPSLVLDGATGHLVAAYNDDPWMNAAQGIGASYSPDGGLTWFDCPPLASVWGFWEVDPSVVSDQAGFIYAAMASCDQIAPGGPGTPINSGIYVYVSTDGGQTFPALNAVSVQSGTAPNTPWETKPKLEVDDDPTSPFHTRVYAIWERDLPVPHPTQWQYSDAWFAWSPPGGAGWGILPAPLNDGTPFDEVLWPDLAVGPLGDVVAAWLDSPVAVAAGAPQGQIWFDRSTDGGQTFGPDVPVTTFWTVPGMMTDATGQPARTAMSYPSVEVDPANPNHVGIVYAADPDTGPRTDARVDLGDQPPGSSDVGLVNPFHGTYNIDGSTQYAHAVWTDQRGIPREVYYNRTTSGLLNWSASDQLLSTQPAGQKQNANNANILCDGASNVYAAWDQWNGIDFTHTIYFNRSTSEGAPGSWLSQAIPLDHLYRAAWEPMLSCDANHVCAAWIVAGVDAQHTDLYVNYSADAGATWQNPEIPVRTGQWVLSHHIAQSGNHVYLVWEEATGSGGSAIYFSRSANYGAPPWSTPIQLSSAAAGDVLFAPKICCEMGNVYVTWVDTRNGLYDPYFTWSNNYGGAGSWSPDVPINDAVTPGTSREYFSQIACGYGNVYVVYESDRTQVGVGTEEVWINCSIGGGGNWMGEQRLDLGDPPAPAIGRHSCHPRLVVGGIDVDAHIYVT